jgi:acetyl-CoA carboxylase biotin carboxylase subunit
MSNIIAAAEITNSDAIHPGYGFLAENAKFSKICEEHNIKFIGATAEMINLMGDKASARETMKNAGVPIIPGSDGILETFEEAEKLAEEMGYPVMAKATAGGGGKGMRAVWKKEEFRELWDAAKQEAKASFGNDDMYLEKLIEEPRHIEIQIVGDSTGRACHLSERDCSVQRRHQKLTEETPSPFMTKALRKKMGEAAVLAAESIKYEGAGTVEFLVDKNRNFYFMEMNTRIQVEHPITEQVIDFDLIREQIMVAGGVPISGKNYTPKLHAIECRINAEDPYNDFRPSPGKITTLHAPGGHGIRLDTHVYAGYSIPPNYDSMIAKLITTAQTREEAISKMKRALDEFVIEGIKTTIPFHRQLMEHPDYLAGNYTTKFMEDFVMDAEIKE